MQRSVETALPMREQTWVEKRAKPFVQDLNYAAARTAEGISNNQFCPSSFVLLFKLLQNGAAGGGGVGPDISDQCSA